MALKLGWSMTADTHMEKSKWRRTDFSQGAHGELWRGLIWGSTPEEDLFNGMLLSYG